jgi:short-subunit dehydrogenase
VTTARPTPPSTRPLALVTGASNGIGLEIARELADGGHDLVATGRSARPDDVAEELRGLGVDAHAVRADLADYDAVEALWKTVTELGRPLEVAVLNAGVGIGGAFADVDLAEDLRLIDLNVKSVVHLAKRVVVDMIPRRRGIMMTSSISATQPTPFETLPSRCAPRFAVLCNRFLPERVKAARQAREARPAA